jgi:hypothetical protein
MARWACRSFARFRANFSGDMFETPRELTPLLIFRFFPATDSDPGEAIDSVDMADVIGGEAWSDLMADDCIVLERKSTACGDGDGSMWMAFAWSGSVTGILYQPLF